MASIVFLLILEGLSLQYFLYLINTLFYNHVYLFIINILIIIIIIVVVLNDKFQKIIQSKY